MKIIFLGTPDFATVSLQALLSSKHEVLAVVTQPDKPAGRNREITVSPVKLLAEQKGIPVLQFEKISRDGVGVLRNLGAELMVTCAYGQILSREIIDIAPHGIINVHASLLPKYRGAAPIQWAIINGDRETGVTIMQTEEGLDTGDILYVEKTEIGEDETAGELFDRLAKIGAHALLSAIDLIESGNARFTKQDHSQATKVRMLKKSDGLIDWSMDAQRICNLVRGMNPWPVAYTTLEGKTLKIFKCHRVEQKNRRRYACGEIVEKDAQSGFVVACGQGLVSLDVIQAENAKRMSAREFLNGHKLSCEVVGG